MNANFVVTSSFALFYPLNLLSVYPRPLYLVDCLITEHAEVDNHLHYRCLGLSGFLVQHKRLPAP